MNEMGRRRRVESDSKSQTLPSSPSHSFSSSSSSDFEFTVSQSPLKSSSNHLCPADELFYKGQLLPLHLSPRLSMVRTLLLASSSTASSSSDTTTTASRDSTGSSTESTSSFASDLVLLPDCDSSRPSSVAEDDDFKRLSAHGFLTQAAHGGGYQQIKKSKYFSFSRLSSVFRKDSKGRESDNVSGSSVKRMSSSAREVIRKYLKKVKPLYEKLSQKQQCQQQKMGTDTTGAATLSMKSERSIKDVTGISVQNSGNDSRGGGFSHSFSGNLRYPRRRRCVSSCPSSMRSSPSHSGVLCRNMYATTGRTGGISHMDSTMEELQSAIQGAIAHCKNSMGPSKSMVSNEI